MPTNKEEGKVVGDAAVARREAKRSAKKRNGPVVILVVVLCISIFQIHHARSTISIQDFSSWSSLIFVSDEQAAMAAAAATKATSVVVFNSSTQVSDETPLSSTHVNARTSSIQPRISLPLRSLRPPSSDFAYVFMIWGVDPTRPTSYRPYLANILISAHLLARFGSKQDVVIMIRMMPGYLRLLPEDEAMLQGLYSNSIRILYMPILDFSIPNEDNNDNTTTIPPTKIPPVNAMMNKFDVWNLTEYQRVLYLDSDVMPLVNLDYILQMSQDGRLQPTVVVSGYLQPANGGFIVLQPKTDDYQRLQELIWKMPRSYKQFNTTLGWGHVITADDKWETNRKSKQGREWTFYAAHLDQGLLYHYPKYVQHRLSNIFSRKVVTYGPAANGDGVQVVQEWMTPTVLDSPFYNRTQTRFSFVPDNCNRITARNPDPGWPGCIPPYSHYHHFTGKDKPWKQPPPAPIWQAVNVSTITPRSSQELWWKTLRELHDLKFLNATTMGLNLDLPAPKAKRKKGKKHK